jgi:hypothetical protein
VVNDSSLDGSFQNCGFVFLLVDDVLLELFESEDHVVEGIIGVLEGLVGCSSNVSLFFVEELNLVVEWGSDFAFVHHFDLSESHFASHMDFHEVGESVSLSQIDGSDEGVSQCLVKCLIDVVVSSDTVVAIDVVLVGVVVVSTMAVIVTVMTSGATWGKVCIVVRAIVSVGSCE